VECFGFQADLRSAFLIYLQAPAEHPLL